MSFFRHVVPLLAPPDQRGASGAVAVLLCTSRALSNVTIPRIEHANPELLSLMLGHSDSTIIFSPAFASCIEDAETISALYKLLSANTGYWTLHRIGFRGLQAFTKASPPLLVQIKTTWAQKLRYLRELFLSAFDRELAEAVGDAVGATLTYLDIHEAHNMLTVAEMSHVFPKFRMLHTLALPLRNCTSGGAVVTESRFPVKLGEWLPKLYDLRVFVDPSLFTDAFAAASFGAGGEVASFAAMVRSCKNLRLLALHGVDGQPLDSHALLPPLFFEEPEYPTAFATVAASSAAVTAVAKRPSVLGLQLRSLDVHLGASLGARGEQALAECSELTSLTLRGSARLPRLDGTSLALLETIDIAAHMPSAAAAGEEARANEEKHFATAIASLRRLRKAALMLNSGRFTLEMLAAFSSLPRLAELALISLDISGSVARDAAEVIIRDARSAAGALVGARPMSDDDIERLRDAVPAPHSAFCNPPSAFPALHTLKIENAGVQRIGSFVRSLQHLPRLQQLSLSSIRALQPVMNNHHESCMEVRPANGSADAFFPELASFSIQRSDWYLPRISLLLRHAPKLSRVSYSAQPRAFNSFGQPSKAGRGARDSDASPLHSFSASVSCVRISSIATMTALPVFDPSVNANVVCMDLSGSSTDGGALSSLDHERFFVELAALPSLEQLLMNNVNWNFYAIGQLGNSKSLRHLSLAMTQLPLSAIANGRDADAAKEKSLPRALGGGIRSRFMVGMEPAATTTAAAATTSSSPSPSSPSASPRALPERSSLCRCPSLKKLDLSFATLEGDLVYLQTLALSPSLAVLDLYGALDETAGPENAPLDAGVRRFISRMLELKTLDLLRVGDDIKKRFAAAATSSLPSTKLRILG